MSQISQDIFAKIRSRFRNIVIGNAEGKTTLSGDEAVFFEFDYKNKGNVVINLQDDSLLVFFPNKMVEELDQEQSDEWYDFLRDLRQYGHQNMLNFELHNINKSRLNKKDYEYLTTNNNKQDEITMESRMYGGKRKSYLEMNGARLVITHKKTVDEEKRGARSRNITSIYIENENQEKFKFPNTYLPAAKAMTRHVSNGGYPNDERGIHIQEIMSEMMDLRKFVRRTKKGQYTTEGSEIIEDATARYYGLKDTLVTLQKQNSYNEYFENWNPDQIEVDENDLEDIKAKLTQQIFDNDLDDTLRNVSKAVALQKGKRMEVEADEYDPDDVTGLVPEPDPKDNKKDTEKRSDTELDAVAREKDMSLSDFASGPDKLVLLPSKDDDAELQAYMEFVKSSDLPKDKRNMAIVQRILIELANRFVEDEYAVAANRLDTANKEDLAIAFKLAKKYLGGAVEIETPGPRKTRSGSDKMESWDDYEAAIEETSDMEEGTRAALEKISKQLAGSSSMHKDQAKKIDDFLDKEEDKEVEAVEEVELDEANPAKMSDEVLKRRIKQMQDSLESRGDSPAVEFELKRLKKELKKRKMDENNTDAEIDYKVGEGKSPHKKGTKKYKAHMAAMHAEGSGDKDFKDMSREDLIDFLNMSEEDAKDMSMADLLDAAEDKNFDVAESTDNNEDMAEIAKLKAMAGIGSNTMSNHGIREGEAGYKTTPRSIIAREMRKLQDLEKK